MFEGDTSGAADVGQRDIIVWSEHVCCGYPCAFAALSPCSRSESVFASSGRARQPFPCVLCQDVVLKQKHSIRTARCSCVELLLLCLCFATVAKITLFSVVTYLGAAEEHIQPNSSLCRVVRRIEHTSQQAEVAGCLVGQGAGHQGSNGWVS